MNYFSNFQNGVRNHQKQPAHDSCNERQIEALALLYSYRSINLKYRNIFQISTNVFCARYWDFHSWMVRIYRIYSQERKTASPEVFLDYFRNYHTRNISSYVDFVVLFRNRWTCTVQTLKQTFSPHQNFDINIPLLKLNHLNCSLRYLQLKFLFPELVQIKRKWNQNEILILLNIQRCFCY